jgi:hypothetical protein
MVLPPRVIPAIFWRESIQRRGLDARINDRGHDNRLRDVEEAAALRLQFSLNQTARRTNRSGVFGVRRNEKLAFEQ